jgi:hypothetical protein
MKRSLGKPSVYIVYLTIGPLGRWSRMYIVTNETGRGLVVSSTEGFRESMRIDWPKIAFFAQLGLRAYLQGFDLSLGVSCI